MDKPSTPPSLHWLTDGTLRVGVVTDAGPRVAALHRGDGANLFVERDDVAVSGMPGIPEVRVHGGHRMWLAPEVPSVTYVDDDRPLDVAIEDDRITVGRAVDGLRRSMTVRLEDGEVLVDHRVRNESHQPVTAAPWGITQLPTGGRAVLPIGQTAPDEHGLQAGGSLITWPYTSLTDARITLGPHWLAVAGAGHPQREGDADVHRLKVGVDGSRGWIAYVREGLAFVIRHDAPAPDAMPVDRGATAECYTDQRYAELETLGPCRRLEPDDTSTHRERWTVHEVGPRATPADVVALLDGT